jgi:PmbA protein
MHTREITSKVIKLAKKEGATDVAARIEELEWYMLRFSNNSLTVTKSLLENELSIFVCINGKKASCSIMNLSKEAIKEATVKTVKLAKSSMESDLYAPLPKGPFKYDKKFRKIGDDDIDIKKLPEIVKVSIESALSSGANRVAGSLIAQKVKILQETSGNARSEFASTMYNLSVRAFSDSEATGQFAATSTSVSKIDAEKIGRISGEIAKMAREPKTAEAGVYDVTFGPMTFANLIQEVADASSAFSVDTKTSFLVGKLNEKIAGKDLNVEDDPLNQEAPGSSPFDQEGLPTFRKKIVENGVLGTYLHNSATSKKMNQKNTANAGLIYPHPFNVVVAEGKKSLDELISSMDNGLYVTNNWYLRYTNRFTGDFSTILRDGLFKIRNGSIEGPIKGLRLSDNMLNFLRNIEELGREKYWIKWWEVEVPVLTGAALVRQMRFTKPTI